MSRSVKFIVALVFVLVSSLVQAQETTIPAGVPPLETTAGNAIIVEGATGDVLFDKAADQQMATSSMSKVLTMYLVFEAIKNGKLRMTDEVTVSEHAWRQEGSRMFVNVGEKVKVEDLVRGVIVQSGNDAAVVLAEAVAGTEPQFAELMNAKAAQLGMAHSHFKNATGLPDPEHYSTARDLAALALAMIRDFPEDYHYYSEVDFTYNKIKQGNRNPLLYRNMGVDGLKTGHTEAAGFGLIASAMRDSRRIVMVANGMKGMQDRADEAAKIMEWGFREYGLNVPVKQGQALGTAKVWAGVEPSVPMLASKDVQISLPKTAQTGHSVKINFDEPVTAPVKSGQILGKAFVTAPGRATIEVPLIAGGEVAEVGAWERLWLKLQLLLGRV